MWDSALLIAALTGATAVFASWVTSLGNAKAARIQADAAERTQRRTQLRESRRAAYLDVIEHAHRMGELYWEISATRHIEDPAERVRALTVIQPRERDAYAQLRHGVRVVDLEGPPSVAAAAEALKGETRYFYRALGAMVRGEAGADDEFRSRYEPFWAALARFIDSARDALHDE